MNQHNTDVYNDWEIIRHKNLKIKNSYLIEGMPGIGNVGKISMDVLIEETRAKLIMSFSSHNMPNSVFVNENNLVDLPKIGLYHARIKNKDILFLTGDVQPTTEASSYAFTEMVMELLKEYNCTNIMTLGGIGLANVPDTPKVYITGNNASFVKNITDSVTKKGLKVEKNIYGMVGPIMGVSGLMLGISKKHNIPACSLLAETFGHPMYVGLKGSREILRILDKIQGFGLKLSRLDKEIKELEQKGNDTEPSKYRQHPDVNYIG